jgi:hypothetical protein
MCTTSSSSIAVMLVQDRCMGLMIRMNDEHRQPSYCQAVYTSTKRFHDKPLVLIRPDFESYLLQLGKSAFTIVKCKE